MAYRWKFTSASGFYTETELTEIGALDDFESVEQAQQWLGEHYEDLLDLDINEVALYQGDELAFGPMSLDE